MSYTTQRDRIETLLNGITDIGQVHAIPQFGDAVTNYGTTIDGLRQLRGWEIQMGDEGIRTLRLETDIRHRYFPWVITGFMSLDTDRATYDTLIGLAETIANTVELDRANGQILNGTALDFSEETTISDPLPITLGGGPLAWGLTVRFTTYEILQP